MKVFYTTLFSLALSLISTGILYSQELEEYTIKNLIPDSQGVVSRIQSGDVDLEIKVSDYTTGTRTFFIPCLNLESNFPQVTLNMGGTLDVIDKGNSRIWSVEYIGCCANQAGSSGCLSAVSTDGQTYPADNYWNKTGFPNNVTKGVFLTGNTQDVCKGFPYTIQIPDTVYQGSGKVEHTGFRSEIKVVRLIWGVKSFAGKNVTEIGEQPEIYGLKIKVLKPDITVSLESSSDQEFEMIKESRAIYSLNMNARVEVYTLSGSPIMYENNTRKIDLSGCSPGVYIIRAVSPQSGESLVEKIIL